MTKPRERTLGCDRLQHGCGDLERESDQTDLSEIELKRFFQNRIHRRDQRLNRVVKQVRKAGGKKNRENGFVFRFRQSRTCLTAPPFLSPLRKEIN